MKARIAELEAGLAAANSARIGAVANERQWYEAAKTAEAEVGRLRGALERTEKERDEFFAEAREYWALILELREALAGGGQ